MSIHIGIDMKKFLSKNSDFIVLSLGRLLQAVGAVISIRFMTEVLPPEQIGLQYVIYAAILWFSLVLVNPFGMFINRYLYEWKEKGELVTHLKKINFYFLGVASLSVLLFMLNRQFAVLTINAEIQSLNFIVYAFVYLYLSTWYQTLTSFFNIFKMQKVFVFLTNLSQYLGLLIAVSLVTTVAASAHMWLYGLLSGQILSLCLGLYLFNKYVIKDLPAHDVSIETKSIFNHKTFQFCYPVAITTFSIWFLAQGYRFIIEAFGGLSLLASLGIGLGLALNCAGVVEAIVSQFLYPTYYSSLKVDDPQSGRQAWLELWQKSTSVYIPLIFFCVGNVFLILRILVSESFLSIENFVIFGFCVELLRLMSNVLYISLHGELKTKMSILPYGAAAIFLLISLQLSHRFSYFSVQAVLGLLIMAQGLVLFLMFRNAVKTLQYKIPLSPLFSLVVKSLPLLAAVFVFHQTTPLWMLLAYACVSGAYLLFLLRRFNNLF